MGISNELNRRCGEGWIRTAWKVSIGPRCGKSWKISRIHGTCPMATKSMLSRGMINSREARTTDEPDAHSKLQPCQRAGGIDQRIVLTISIQPSLSYPSRIVSKPPEKPISPARSLGNGLRSGIPTKSRRAAHMKNKLTQRSTLTGVRPARRSRSIW